MESKFEFAVVKKGGSSERLVFLSAPTPIFCDALLSALHTIGAAFVVLDESAHVTGKLIETEVGFFELAVDQDSCQLYGTDVDSDLRVVNELLLQSERFTEVKSDEGNSSDSRAPHNTFQADDYTPFDDDGIFGTLGVPPLPPG